MSFIDQSEEHQSIMCCVYDKEECLKTVKHFCLFFTTDAPSFTRTEILVTLNNQL